MLESKEMMAEVILLTGDVATCEVGGWFSFEDPVSAIYLNALFPVLHGPAIPDPITPVVTAAADSNRIKEIISIPSGKWVSKNGTSPKGDDETVF